MAEEAKGYFLIERKTVRTLSPVALQVFIILCERARYNGNVSNKLGIELPVGGVVFGIRELATLCDRDPRRIRTALKELTQNRHTIDTRATHRGHTTVIGKLDLIGKQETRDRHTVDTKPHPNKPEPEPEPEKLCIASVEKRTPKENGAEELAKQVLLEFNKITGREFRASKASLAPIRARLTEPDAPSFEQIQDMVSIKFKQWGEDPEMKKFLRPETIFGASKFDAYIVEGKEARKLIESASEFFT